MKVHYIKVGVCAVKHFFDFLRQHGKSELILETLRKPPNEPPKDKTVLRQAQHERQIFNNFNTHPFTLSLSKGSDSE